MADNPPALAALQGSLKGLRKQALRARRELASLAPRLSRLHARMEQVAVLQQEGPEVGERLDYLAQVLDVSRIQAHIRAIVGATEVVPTPLTHVRISQLLPQDVYEALVAAIPPRVFFEETGRGRLELGMPPALAPTTDMVVWRFFGRSVAGLLAEALVSKLDSPITAAVPPYNLSHGRLIMRTSGFQPRRTAPHPVHALTIIFDLARAGDTRDYGGVLQRAGGGDTREFPFQANTALVFASTLGNHTYEPIPDDAAPAATRVTYEFHVKRATHRGAEQDEMGPVRIMEPLWPRV